MSTEPLIPVDVYCEREELDITFVQALTERGLIQLVLQQERAYIEPEQIGRVEQLARLHFDLEINLEGIEAISHLLERITRMQEEMHRLKERLRLHDAG